MGVAPLTLLKLFTLLSLLSVYIVHTNQAVLHCLNRGMYALQSGVKNIKIAITISRSRFLTTPQPWFQSSFWNHDWTIFLLQNWQNVRYKQTNKQTNKQKLKISISTTRLPTTSQSWFQNSFWNHDWTIFLLQNWHNVRYIKWEKALYKMKKSEKTTFQWPK